MIESSGWRSEPTIISPSHSIFARCWRESKAFSGGEWGLLRRRLLRDEVIRFEGWLLDVARRQFVSPKGEDVALTTGEFDLLAALARHPGRVLGREALMDLTRGRSRETFDRTIDAQVARLRKKIEADPKNPMLVKSVRNVGYVFTGKVDR